MDRRTLPCDLVSRGFHRLSFLSTITKVFQHASSLNLFHPGLLHPDFPRSVLPRKASLTKPPYQHSSSPTRAGEHNLLTTAFSELRPGSRRCVLLTAVYLPGIIVVTSGCDCFRSRNPWPFG